MTGRIFLKLVLAFLCILVIALAGVHYLASKTAENVYGKHLRAELLAKSRLLSFLPEDRLIAQVDQLARGAGARITLIAADGRVLADSSANAAQMENHSGRPEVQQALRGQIGWSERSSKTIEENLLYLAIPYGHGVLRLSMSTSLLAEQARALRGQVWRSTLLAIIPAALIALLFARFFSRKLAAIIAYAGQLAQGNFEARLAAPSKDEFGVLGQQLNETAEKLQGMFKQLESEHRELEKLERVRKDFVINVSHELRTPLASIQGYAETLLDGALHDEDNNVRFLTIIRQNAERLARLTADLLTLSRIEMKRQNFQFAAYYVNQLIREDIDTMRPMAGKKGIEIIFHPAPDASEVFCDAEAVHQVLANLLDNALKYTPEGGVVHIGAAGIPGKGGGTEEMVELYVKDSGVGIPPDDLPRLFERFYRVDKARSRELGGTGLGLAIVKHLVLAQGGDVSVTSEVNGETNPGSTFRFTLPVHDLGQAEQSDIEPELTSF